MREIQLQGTQTSRTARPREDGANHGPKMDMITQDKGPLLSLGPHVPPRPPNPAGISRGRAFLQDRLPSRRGGGEDARPLDCHPRPHSALLCPLGSALADPTRGDTRPPGTAEGGTDRRLNVHLSFQACFPQQRDRAGENPKNSSPLRRGRRWGWTDGTMTPDSPEFPEG